jgi:PilZ domain
VEAPLFRRAESRIAFKMFVKLSDPATGAFEITSTIDVSCHGARLLTKSPWNRNKDLSVQPIRGSLASRGRVAHCKIRGDGSYEIGLELYPSTEDWTRSGKLPTKLANH